MRVNLFLVVLWVFPSVLGVWYINSQLYAEVINCSYECETNMDCPADLSCFQSHQNKGCCLRVIKPNETGCVLDEQCSRACHTSYCSKAQEVGRCICKRGHNFLFGKCWQECPPFAFQKAPLNTFEPLATQCLVNPSELTNELFNQPRQTRSINYC